MTSRATVFIVDDDLSVRRSLSRLVIAAGYDVRVFASAQAVLAEIDWPHPCCLIVDVSMPGMTGLDLLDALRSLRRTVPVILSSGYGDSATLARARQADVLAFLAKPFRASTLLPLLEQALGRRADADDEPSALPSHQRLIRGF